MPEEPDRSYDADSDEDDELPWCPHCGLHRYDPDVDPPATCPERLWGEP